MNSKAWERPAQPGKTQQPNRSHPSRDRGGNRGGSDRNPDPSETPNPWLETDPNHPHHPDASASFVEYLRWMREPSLTKDQKSIQEDNETKLLLLQKAQESAQYRDRLETLTQRTRNIAAKDGIYFTVTCPWRIRVGGHRGPESILLPAFDALGMPYIPSATLRGVARNQGIRKFLPQCGGNWTEAEKKVSKYLGALDAEAGDRCGKIIFLDAYPDPNESSNGGLAIDMANNLWKWENGQPTYKANLNLFFSLKNPTFAIGLRPRTPQDRGALETVKTWLIAGLQGGVGSQANTGYGRLTETGDIDRTHQFFSLEFTLNGQLIHSHQAFSNSDRPYKYNAKNELKANTAPISEVRPVAFKSMLRYWFRTLSLGVLPGDRVQLLEALLFGAIDPQKLGWVQVQIANGKIVRDNAQSKRDEYGIQTGELVLSYSHEAPETQKDAIAHLLEHLTWLMFHLGGIGQGARRPCYSRQNRPNPRPPYWRGCTLIPHGDTVKFNPTELNWTLPTALEEFAKTFQQRLTQFYQKLEQLQAYYIRESKGQQSAIAIDPKQPRSAGKVTTRDWVEAVDKNCCILVVRGNSNHEKPFALATLHSEELKREITNKKNEKQLIYDGNLCGTNNQPSPTWIAEIFVDKDNSLYEVVTIFGATTIESLNSPHPRAIYLKKLRKQGESKNIWPFKI